MKLGLIALGCSKNRVDAENLLGELRARGFSITPHAEEAEVIVVNTCGFIEPAKQESINTVLEMAAFKKQGNCRLLVMSGCLSERYAKELQEAMPEVDIFWGVRNQAELAVRIAERAGLESVVKQRPERMLTTPFYSAYLRIADGCDNRCSYCAIPLIRGGRHSVDMDTLVEEARSLGARGVKELTLIAQDTSAYGIDIYGKPVLPELLARLERIEEIRWLRLLYTYPSTVDETLLACMAGSQKIAHYLDMPIQHIDDTVLTRMNRKGSSAHIRSLFAKIRREYPDFILRTTLMVGFPGETDAQFQALLDFVQEMQFDRLGAFSFSPEEGTAAADMDAQIPEAVKAERLDALMRLQQQVSLRRNEARVGQEYKVLVDRVGKTYAYGRSYAEAPEVDGHIRFAPRKGCVCKPGDFIKLRVTHARTYDLEGEEL